MQAQSNEQVLADVSQIVADTLKLPTEKLDIDLDLESFGMDSIITIELITNLSKSFAIAINPAQFTNVDTVRDLAELIYQLVSKDSAPAPAAPAAAAPAPAASNKGAGLEDLAAFANGNVAATEPAPAAPTAPVAASASVAASAAVSATGNSRRRGGRGRRRNRAAANGAVNSAASGQLQELVSSMEQLFGISLQGQAFGSQDELVEFMVAHYPQQLKQFYQRQRDGQATAQATTAQAAPQAATAPALSANAKVQVAVVGMSCRFPGAENIESYWQNLMAGHSAVTQIPAERWDVNEYFADEPASGKTVSKWAGLIDDFDCFDPDFFGLSAEDAQMIDPQERILMQQVYHAFEDAGVDVKSLEGSDTGIFVGYEYAEYEQYMRQQLGPDAQYPPNSSSQMYYLANRVSHVFDFCGPSEAINTNCASSAVAINRAWHALLNGECQYAVAAGTCLHLFPDDYIAASQYGLLSGDGTSSVFDRDASGFTRGEGVGVVVLKRLDQAMADSDRVYALVRHSQQNHRGRASDISEIKHEAITKLLVDCYQKAGIDSSAVQYIELDGYATMWGDSFEYEGIKNAFMPHHVSGQKHCGLGSVKANIGHLEPASGVASFIKVALGLYHGEIPATTTAKQISDFIDLEAADHPLYFATETVALSSSGSSSGAGHALAAVNSFADSGTNVHLLLEQYAQPNHAVSVSNSSQVFVFSANGLPALSRQIADVKTWLSDNMSADSSAVAFSMQRRRGAFSDRLAIIAADLKELSRKIDKVNKAQLDQPLNMEGQGVFYGNVEQLQTNPMLRMMTSELSQQHIDQAMEQQDWQTLALLWAGGVNVDWRKLWQGSGVTPISLPLYSFAREAIWYGERDPAYSLSNQQVARQASQAKVKQAVKAAVDKVKDDAKAAETEEQAQGWSQCWTFDFDESGENAGDNKAEDTGEELAGDEKIQAWLRQQITQQINCHPQSVSTVDNFLELGMNSMNIAQLLQELNQFLAAKLAPSLLFKHYSIALLSDYIADKYATKLENLRVKSCDGAAVAQADSHQTSPNSGQETLEQKVLEQEGKENQVLPTTVDSPIPLSLSEKGLYFIQTLQPSSFAYNVPVCFAITTPVTAKAIAAVWLRLHSKFPILRSRIEQQESELFHVLDRQPSELVVVEDKFESEQQRIDWLNQQVQVPFNLETDALCRAHLLQGSSQGKEHKSTLLFTFHHIICDGISSVILLRNFFTLLQAELAGDHSMPEPAPVAQAQLVVQEQQYLSTSESEQDIEYWQQQLAKVTAEKLLQPDSHNSGAGATQSGNEHSGSHTKVIALPQELHNWLKDNAKQNMLQSSSMLMAVFKLLLHKYTGAESVVVGMPVMGAVHAENELAVGHFINMIPLCTSVDTEQSLLDFCHGVQEIMMDGLYHSSLPVAKMQELRRESGQMEDEEIINVLFSFQDFAQEDQVIAPEVKAQLGVELVDDSISQQGDYNFGLEVYEKADGTDLHFKFEPSLYSQGLIDTLGQYFVHLLQTCKQSLEQSVAQVSMLDEQGRQLVVETFNDTKADFPADTCVYELFVQFAKANPEHIAVQDENGELSYGELAKRTETLARFLQLQGVGKDSLVGLYLSRSVDMMVAILGILRAGGAYVPLDPDYPEARLQHMVSDSGCQFVLSQSWHQESLDSLLSDGCNVLHLDTGWQEIEQQVQDKAKPLAKLSGPEDLAYVIYTSGSTGLPKGVMLEHRALMNRVHWMQRAYPIDQDDVVLQKTPYSFDVSVWEFVWPMMMGAKTVFARPGGHSDVDYLCGFINQYGITVLHFVPSMLNIFLDLAPDSCPNVRYTFSSGEALNKQSAVDYPRIFTNGQLHNLYGPTEAAIDVTYYDCQTVPGTTVPIGKPIDNIQIYILDERLQPVPVGVPGELHIAGVGLARGYLNREELTAEKFIDNPFTPNQRMYKSGDLACWLDDGNIEYLGRIDNQVKLRGFRIETGEIEAGLVEHEQVKDAVVVVQGEGAGAQLVAFYVSDAKVESTELQTWLSARLPEHMIPFAWQQLEDIPLTPNGKVDRKRLVANKVQVQSHKEYVAPQNEQESRLVTIWSQVLELAEDKVSVEDSFFDLRGNSLSALQLMAKINQAFDRLLPLATLFKAPTIRALADFIANNETDSGNTLVCLQEGGEGTPVFAVPGDGGNVFSLQPLADATKGLFPFYGLQASGLDGVSEPFESIEAAAELYAKVIKEAYPQGPYRLLGVSYGGPVVYEVARQLQQNDNVVEQILFVDSIAPKERQALNAEALKSDTHPAPIVKVSQIMAELNDIEIQMNGEDYAGLSIEAQCEKATSLFNQHGVDIEAEQFITLFKVYLQHDENYLKYQPAPYHSAPRGEPVVVKVARAMQNQDFSQLDNDYGWQELFESKVQTSEFEADHYSIAEFPHNHSVIELLSSPVKEAVKAPAKTAAKKPTNTTVKKAATKQTKARAKAPAKQAAKKPVAKPTSKPAAKPATKPKKRQQKTS